jgi:tetratricopeptide (TPR) repeat protein
LTSFCRLSSGLAFAGISLLFPLLGASSATQSRGSTSSDRLEAWREAVEAHTPGEPGKVAVDISSWSGSDLEGVVADVKRHARSLAKQDLEIANRFLLRGAEFHADIARLIPDDSTRRSEKQLSVFTVADGRWLGVKYLSIHWQLARSLIDGVLPEPSAYEPVRRWYRDTSRELLLVRSLVEVQGHLARGVQIFPKDGLLLFYRGALHERYSSSLMQAGSASLDDANRGASTIGTTNAELSRAERWLREALVYEPDHVEARLRHGHVIGDLGRHQEAISELQRVVDAGPPGELLYLAHLFLGREYEALKRYDEARAALERAADLYPNAQTPRLALSQIARRTGNRTAARRELDLLAKLPDVEREREDPWWDYYDIR